MYTIHHKEILAKHVRQGKDFSRGKPLILPWWFKLKRTWVNSSAMPTDPHHTPIITQPSSSQPQRKQKSRRSKRKENGVPQPSDPTNVADETVNKEPSMQLNELMDFYTKLQQRVLDLEIQRLLKLRRLQGRKIHDIDVDEDITLENVHDAEMFDVNDLDGDEMVVENEVVAKKKDDEVNVVEEVVSSAEETVNAAIITEDEITLAQALEELKSVKPKVTTATTTTTKGILLQEPSESITTKTTTTITIPSKDKGKGIMVKQSLQMKKKDQITFDEQEAIGLQVEFDEEVRLEREKDKANNMAGWKPKDLKSKSFANIQELFDKAFKRVNTFVDFRTELVDGSDVRAKGSETREENDAVWRRITGKQRVGLEDLIPVEYICEVSKSTCLYVGREEISLYTCYNHRYAK
ncbi:hypothetical protein Tco_1123109 [Tanacetum coccineum]|uniref:Uncharacterized protein n=1 Tax=Tanacetum coccineum TaxID=301880 RepID=A0ABQ5J2P1_9ASTR